MFSKSKCGWLGVAGGWLWLVLLAPWPALGQPLEGFADMHTHPMAHLGFGGMILYGAPDLGALMLSGQKYRGWAAFSKN